jgi:hypothetical protein
MDDTENTPKFGIVTATRYESANTLRAQLAQKTIKSARRNDIPIIIIDDSPRNVRTCFQKIGGDITIEPQISTGFGSAIRQAFLAGIDAGWDVIVWMEPEKYPLVPLLLPAIMRVAHNLSDMVIPRRLSMHSYPPYQRRSERKANRQIRTIMKRPDILDLMFGPRVVSKRVAQLFADYEPPAGSDMWETLFVPVFQSLNNWDMVTSMTVHYIHPPEQTATENGDPAMDRKRDLQRQAIIKAMRGEARRLKELELLHH